MKSQLSDDNIVYCILFASKSRDEEDMRRIFI